MIIKNPEGISMNNIFTKLFSPSIFKYILVALVVYFLFCINSTNSYASNEVKTSTLNMHKATTTDSLTNPGHPTKY